MDKFCTGLRFVKKDGKNILQARWLYLTHAYDGTPYLDVVGAVETEWQDVPLIERESAQ